MTTNGGCRLETPDDVSSVRRVLIAAFGRDDEANLVERLRHDRGWISPFSVVCERENTVVAMACCSRLDVVGAPALALGPVAVTPHWQAKGLGSEMVQTLIDAARQAGERVIVVLGDPGYYARFGFVPADSLGITGPYESAGDSFAALPLVSVGVPGGWATYASAFDVETSLQTRPRRQPQAHRDRR